MRVTGLLLCAALAACGVSHDGNQDETGATLTIDPPAVELLIIDGAPATQTYSATLTYADGSSRDVTDETTFSVDSAFGSFTADLATIGTPGKTVVFGQRNDKIGQGSLIARLKTRRIDPSLPATTPDLFDGPEDPTRAPNIVYPADGIVMPRNVGDFESHWTDGSGNDVFELSLTTEFADLRIYVPGGNGNLAAGPMASFAAFAPADWFSAVGVEPSVHYQVRGVQLANPTSVGSSPIRTVALTNETMDGGLYYWAAAGSNGTEEGIYRHDMTKPGQPAEPYLTSSQAGRCVACHALSRDGTKMAITYDGGGGNGTMVDVATAARQTEVATWNFATFTPDGSQLFTVSNGTLTVRNAADQSPLATMPAGVAVTHPDVSADGTKLVYVRKNVGGADWSYVSGDIYVRTYDQTTHTFGAEVPLVTGNGNNFYPSWSPDGQWVLFNRSADNGSAYNNPNAQLFVVKADGSAPPIELTGANIGLGLTNSWGRWAPFKQTVNGDEPIFWVTVSSKRNFGVRLFNAGRPQIWMTPFFPERAGSAQDPSVPAFRLPFQSIDSDNHIAQWTERIVTL